MKGQGDLGGPKPHLASLSPDIQKAIVHGTLDHRLTTDHLLRTGIALDWTRQSEGFGL